MTHTHTRTRTHTHTHAHTRTYTHTHTHTHTRTHTHTHAHCVYRLSELETARLPTSPLPSRPACDRGWEQHEVTCVNKISDPNTLWNVEGHINAKCECVSPHSCVHLSWSACITVGMELCSAVSVRSMYAALPSQCVGG